MSIFVGESMTTFICPDLQFRQASFTYWLDLISVLLPRLFISIIVGLILIRCRWFRCAMQRAEGIGRYRLILIIVFGLFAMLGTHSGIIIDQHQHVHLPLNPMAMGLNVLNGAEVTVGFRDTWALVAGLAGGWQVGLGTGLLAGIDRFMVGGDIKISTAIATTLLGLFAGLVRNYRPVWTKNVWRVLGVAILGTLLQRLVLLLLSPEPCDTLWLAVQIGIPVAIINIAGCVLFVWIMRDLEHERLENEARKAHLLVLQAQVERDRHLQLAQQSELRALRAQVEPHLLNNTLYLLKIHIRLDPEKARDYVDELAGFLNHMRQFAGQNTISLQQESEQLQRYLHLQNWVLNDRLKFELVMPEHLSPLQVLPMCLVTLVENAIIHAFEDCPEPYLLHISAMEQADNLLLSVQDNGKGIAPERLAELGKAPVTSYKSGGGVALYQITQSLKLEFGETAYLSLTSEDQKGTLAVLSQPKRSA